jgi:hypothetical protein
MRREGFRIEIRRAFFFRAFVPAVPSAVKKLACILRGGD